MNINGATGCCRLVPHNSDEYWQTVALREELLRRPQGLGFSDKELQCERDSFHLVYEINGVIAACVVLKPVGEHRVKLRQMAVTVKCQGQGIGHQLIQWAECWLMGQGYSEVELHARCSAEDFYTEQGYQPIGQPFMEVGLPHRAMDKKLS